MSAIARALGFRVRVSRALGGPRGVLLGRMIGVRPDRPGAVAMSIGHELGHAVDAEWQIFSGRPDVERRMDEVAAAVLMPADDLHWARELRIPARHLLERHRPIPPHWAARRMHAICAR